MKAKFKNSNQQPPKFQVDVLFIKQEKDKVLFLKRMSKKKETTSQKKCFKLK